MKTLIGLMLALGLILTSTPSTHAADGKINVVAAENFYGDIARQIGGGEVTVASIMSNPDQDPHLFETTPSTVRQIAAAQVVILNGADYDPWMDKLLKASPNSGRIAIVVADLVGKKAGDNPHLWYDPITMPAAAKAMADAFAKADPAHKDGYAARLKTFLASLKLINEKIAAIRGKFAGTPVTASEPVFGYMAAALGLVMRNERFQLAVMNDTEPSASDIAAFEGDLKQHRVKLLIYNSQATDESAKRLLGIAHKSKVPVIGVTETEPPGKTFQDWMLGQLDALDDAMAKPGS